MAAYPTIEQHQNSVPLLRDDILTDFAVGGSVQQRALYDLVRRDFSLVHIVSQADHDTLIDHYLDHRLLAFAFVWQADGSSHTVRYKSQPSEQWSDGWWTVRVDLVAEE